MTMEILGFYTWYFLLPPMIIFTAILLVSLRVVMQLVNRVLLLTIELDC